jgi:hypothetical protein
MTKWSPLNAYADLGWQGTVHWDANVSVIQMARSSGVERDRVLEVSPQVVGVFPDRTVLERLFNPNIKSARYESSLAWYSKGTMLVIFVLATGIAVGILPGLLRLDKMFSPTNMAVGCVGALVGVFLGFGDARLFLEYPFLNEITLMVAVSLLFVAIKVSVTRKPKVP